MLTSTTRSGTFVLAGLGALTFGIAPAPAQRTPTIAPGTSVFRVGLTPQPAVSGPTMTGQVYPAAPYGIAYNPYGPAYAGARSYPGLGPYGATLTSTPSAPGSTDPYDSNSPYNGGYDPYGGYLRGQADLASSLGHYLINEQRAYLVREQVRQAKIETRRRAFDEYLYERRNAPTWEDDRERLLALALRRSRNDPPLTEIWSGKALNDLLADVQKYRGKVSPGLAPAFELDEDLIKRINVSAGKAPGSAGLLKNDGKLVWPLGLRALKPRDRADELRQQLSSLLPEAVGQAVNGRVDPQAIRELARAADELQELLTRNVSELPPGTYMDAKRFLAGLEDGIRLLQQPDAGLYFTQKYTAKGKTVPDLVEHMTRTGLVFAPAVSGDEAAYVAVHRALAAYDAALHAASPAPAAR
jgi:hypothetical protein